MFLMIHLYQIAQLITNGYYIIKQLSESVAENVPQNSLDTKIEQTYMDC